MSPYDPLGAGSRARAETVPPLAQNAVMPKGQSSGMKPCAGVASRTPSTFRLKTAVVSCKDGKEQQGPDRGQERPFHAVVDFPFPCLEPARSTVLHVSTVALQNT